DHAGWAAAPQDVSRRDVSGMAERALALDHDHVRVLTLERGDDLVLDLARAELGDKRIQRDAVLPALDQGGLTGADHDRLDAARVERLDQQGGGGALPDRPVGTQDRDPGTCDIEDPAGEQVQVPLGLRSAYICDGDAGDQRCRHELGVVVEELVQAVDDVHPAGDAVEQHDPLFVRQQAVGGGQPTDQVVRYAAGVRDGLGERCQHRDAVRGAVEEFPGVDAGPEAVDDTEDLVLLRVPYQAVGGLTVLLAEQALAVNDRGGTNREFEGRCREVALALFGGVKGRGTARKRRHKIL